MRYTKDKDYSNDCLTIRDEKERLKTSYDSDITLAPLEDAEIVVNELNRNECVNRALKQTLKDNFFTDEDIQYIVDAANDDFEEELDES